MTGDDVMELSYRMLVSACEIDDDDITLATLGIQEMKAELLDLDPAAASELAMDLALHSASLVRGLAVVIGRTDRDVLVRLIGESRVAWEASKG